MVKCSDDCPVCCDHCKHYAFNGKPVVGLDGKVAKVYVGKGKCRHSDHPAPREPEEHCEDFHCKRANPLGLPSVTLDVVMAELGLTEADLDETGA